MFFLSKNDWSLQYVNNEHQTVCTNYADIQCLHIVFTNMSNKSWHMSNQRDRNKQMLPVTKWRVVLIKHEWSPTIFQATSGVNSECIFFIWWNEQQNTLLFSCLQHNCCWNYHASFSDCVLYWLVLLWQVWQLHCQNRKIIKVIHHHNSYGCLNKVKCQEMVVFKACYADKNVFLRTLTYYIRYILYQPW